MELKGLDPVLHSQLRLAIVSVLVSVGEADFNLLREKTHGTSGNISVQLAKLRTAGYIEISKTFKDNYPLTKCKLTAKGLSAFGNYREAIQDYLFPEKEG
ncbi:MAG: transcriptional regulator [Chitinophagaceae bacterium]|nr:transcriptional regulator [Chitinophagaceae bacterium]